MLGVPARSTHELGRAERGDCKPDHAGDMTSGGLFQVVLLEVLVKLLRRELGERGEPAPVPLKARNGDPRLHLEPNGGLGPCLDHQSLAICLEDGLLQAKRGQSRVPPNCGRLRGCALPVAVASASLVVAGNVWKPHLVCGWVHVVCLRGNLSQDHLHEHSCR